MIPKFRAWDSMNNEWAKSFFFCSEGGIFTPDYGFKGKRHRRTNVYPIVKQERLILMQSTGLFDKNGVEIFEGDFLKNKDKPDTILICKKSDLQASFRACSTNGMISLALWHDESRDWTVIGNIHEHPHLVEVAHD